MRLLPKLMFIAAVAMTGYHLGYHATEKRLLDTSLSQSVAEADRERIAAIIRQADVDTVADYDAAVVGI